MVAFVISSSYAWSSFPYDNVCDPAGGTITATSIPFDNVLTLDQKYSVEQEDQMRINVTVQQEEPVSFCPQGFRYVALTVELNQAFV